MRNFYPLLLLLAQCSQERSIPSHSGVAFELNRKPVVAIFPMEDCAQENFSSKTAQTLTQAIIRRLEKKNHFLLASKKGFGRQFIVQTKLIQHGDFLNNSPEFNCQIDLKILDVRGDKPKVLFEELVTHQTVLDSSIHENKLFENRSMGTSPLGLAYAKLSREIEIYIEDYIGSATKG